MAKKQLNKTYSTFSRNAEANRANEVRRDTDIVKTPKVTIEDVDFAIISFLRDVIKPQIIENGQTIDVPLKSLGVNQNPAGNDFIYRNKHSQENRYGKFSVLQGTKPAQEYYAAPVPEFVDVAYEFLLWTEYTDQMNSLVEQIMPTNGFAYGTTYKFPTFLQDVSFETTNNTGEDRIVRATIPATVKGTLLMPFELRRSNFEKRFSVKKVVFGTESDGFNVSDAPQGGY